MTGFRAGEACEIDAGATLGYEYDSDADRPHIGDGAVVRHGTIIYGDVVIGDGFVTGHDAIVREHTVIGDDVLLGTKSVVDGRSDIGSRVSMQTGVYVPTHTTIGDDVFLGPHAVLTNDPYPLRTDEEIVGPTIEDGVSVGANATILPDVTVGERSFVAAGAVVTEDVPSDCLAVGAPASVQELPPELQGGNGA